MPDDGLVAARSALPGGKAASQVDAPRVRSLHWMYWLAAVPFFTDIAETGRMPHSAREWITEVVAGALIAGLTQRVVRQQRRLADLARSDALTGLRNRLAFDEAIREECARAHRFGSALTLVYIDLDHFKDVNDACGHDCGDRVLRQLADAIVLSVRRHVDRGFRIGGDEFALLLPGVRHPQAAVVLARIRHQVEPMDALWREGPLGVSAGDVQLEPGEQPEQLVARADAAMFASKRVSKTTRGRALPAAQQALQR